MDAMEIDAIIARYGAWVVTPYGLECLVTYYPIEASRLCEGEGFYGWPRHMAVKRWVNLDDFREALEAAREHHYLTSK